MKKPLEDPIPYWQEMINYMDNKWAVKKGVRHYPWKGYDFRELRGLALNLGVGGVMALWDVYLRGETFWGPKTGFMFDGLLRDLGVLLDNPGYKILARAHQNHADKESGLFDVADIIKKLDVGQLKRIGGKL